MIKCLGFFIDVQFSKWPEFVRRVKYAKMGALDLNLKFFSSFASMRNAKNEGLSQFQGLLKRVIHGNGMHFIQLSYHKL